MSTSRVIIIAIVVAVIGAIFLVFTGIIPGRYDNSTSLRNVKGEVIIWSADDTRDNIAPAIQAFTAKSPNIRVDLTHFSDRAEYEQTLLNALASGKGPDIFSFPNSDLDRYLTKIAPIPGAALPILQIRNLFPETVERDLTRGGLVYGLPLSIDTLALFYNKDHFNQSAIVFPPTDWEEFSETAVALTRYDENGGIARAGAALGGPNRLISHGSDILEFIGIQNAAQTGANFDLNPAALSSALQFYTEFARPGFTYVWSDRAPYSEDGFANGKISMILGYAGDLPDLRRRNGLLKIGVTNAPQPKDTQRPVTYARYAGYAVSQFSKSKNLALQFLLSITTNPGFGREYVKITGRPPALRALIQSYIGDPDLDVFARQGLTAVSWPKINAADAEAILSEAIQAVLKGPASPAAALSTAEAKYRRAVRVYDRN